MPYHVGKKGSYGCKGFPALKEDGTVMGCHATAKEAAGQIYAINRSEGNIGKALVAEGDFVIASCDDEIHIGRVEYVMTTGALGLPGSKYYLEATSDAPGVLLRTLEFKEKGQYWEETAYLIGVSASEVTKITPLPLEVEVDVVELNGQMSMQMKDKADTLLGGIFGKDYTKAARQTYQAEANG